MVLRDAAGLVVDSLNYGLLVDPWASEGWQAASRAGQGGCRVSSPAAGAGFGPAGAVPGTANKSAGRFPDGADTDSNCTDFLAQATTTMPVASSAGATNIKVASVTDFAAGQTVMIDSGANQETATIAAVGTAGATTAGSATSIGATVIPVGGAIGFSVGQTITIDSETAVVASIAGGRGGRGGGAGGAGRGPGGGAITVTEPLKMAHVAGAQVAGSGVTFTMALTKPHESGAQVASNVPTPGAPNKYYRKSN
jgi:hypothetical protein